ncbi:hypothetical protein HGA89_07555 [bacterium]|nr:hypothetical protein [bacterium]
MALGVVGESCGDELGKPRVRDAGEVYWCFSLEQGDLENFLASRGPSTAGSLPPGQRLRGRRLRDLEQDQARVLGPGPNPQPGLDALAIRRATRMLSVV